jgi:hypothetical protein
MKWVVAILAAAIALSASPQAHAQLAKVVASCGSETYSTAGGLQQQPLEIDPTGKLCIAGAFSGSFNSSVNATANLPSFTESTSQAPQASRAGATYVQPVFSSASGGGTQVDATHGLPVNVIAGSSSGSFSDQSAFTQGTSSFLPGGWLYTTSPASLASGTVGIARMTTDRMAMADVEKIAGTTAVTGGANGLLAVGGPVASGGTNANNPLKIGGVFNTTQPTVTNAQMVDLQATSRGALIVATGADTLSATINAALPTGANTIGAVTQASGPWTINTQQWNGNQVDTNSGNKSGGTLRAVLATDQPNLTTPLNVASTTMASAANQTNVQVAVGGGTAPASANLAGGVFHTAAPTLTNGQGSEFQFDSAARLIISPTNLSVAQGSTTAGQSGDLIQGAVTTSAPTYTTGQTSPLSLDTGGSLRMNCVTGCAASTYADLSTFTQGSTSFSVSGGIFNSSITNLTSGQAGAFQVTADRMLFVNHQKVAGTTVDTNTGNASAGSQRVVLATNQPAVSVSQNSPPWLVNFEGQKASYRFAKAAITSFDAAPTDWLVIGGSGTKTIRVSNVTVCGTATALSTIDVIPIKRTTADTAGTSASLSASLLDSNDAAATATVVNYTANPTTGTSGNNIDAFKLNLGPGGSAGCASLDFGTRNTREMVLRGTAQQLALNLNGAALPAGASLSARVELTEE